MMISPYDRAIISVGQYLREIRPAFCSRGSARFWREELNDGEIFLREVTDVAATFTGPAVK
jgi:hypothetical protein